VHFSLATEPLDVGGELAAVAADRTAQSVVISESCSETERQYGGMAETIGDHMGVIDGCFLVEYVGGVVFADDDREIAGRVKEDLISENSRMRL
jgi:hypothetical protein